MAADTVVYHAYRFAPATPADRHVYGACAPGWHATRDGPEDIDDWIAFMRGRGIERVCSVVPAAAGDGSENLARYREVFGSEHVRHAPIPDGHLPEISMLRDEILPFLKAARECDDRVVVVGLAGVGRTGIVLAGWLIRHRGYEVDAAIGKVRETGRDPRAVVDRGEPSLGALHALLASLA